MEHYLHNENAHPEWSPGVPNITDLIGRHRVVLAEARADHPAVLDILDPIWADAYLKRLGRSRTLTLVMRARIASCIAVGRLADAEQDLSDTRSWCRDGQAAWSRLASAGCVASWPRRGAKRGRRRERVCARPRRPRAGRLPHAAGAVAAHLRSPRTGPQNRREAVDRLTRARAGFASLRAVPYLQRSSADLDACGLSSHVADPLALTPREEDVVALVTQGLSHKQVTTELFLTVKTVKYHLRNIYTTLGVRSRHELRQRSVTSVA